MVGYLESYKDLWGNHRFAYGFTILRMPLR